MRNTAPLLGLLVAMLSTSSPSMASEEEFLPWQSIQLDCGDHPETGKVTLSAKAGGAGITAFEVTAFGKAHKPAAGDLAKLRNFGLDGLRVTAEAGYPQLGGHTVHFHLRACLLFRR